MDPPIHLRFFWLGIINPQQRDWFGYILENNRGVIKYVLWKRGESQPTSVMDPAPTYPVIEQRSIDAKKQFDAKQNPGSGSGQLGLQILYIGTQLATAAIIIAMATQVEAPVPETDVAIATLNSEL